MIARLARRFRDTSLRLKLLAALLTLFVLPLAVVAAFLNSAVSATLNARICATNFEVLKQTKSAMDTIVHDVRLLSLSILSDDHLQSLLKSYQSGDDATYQAQKIEVTYLLQNAVYDHPSIASICLSDGPQVILQAGQYLTEEPTTWHAQAQRLEGAPLWTGVADQQGLGSSGTLQVISLVRSVNDLYHRQQLATLRISVRESALRSAFQSAQTVNGGIAYLLQDTGAVLSTAGTTQVAKDAAFQPWYPTVTTFAEGYAKTTAGSASTVFQYRVEGAPWRVVQVIPEALLDRQLGELNLLVGFSMVLCLVFGVGMSLIQRRTVLLPLQRLSTEMGKLKVGQFDVSLPGANNDEIGRLSQDFVAMSGKIKELLDTVYVVRLKEKEAALMSLESQINPHFLYNTLDAIRWMAVRKGELEISEQIEALSALFRHTLNQGHELTTWRDEMAHLRNYLLIQSNRFGDRIRFELKVEPEVLEFLTVKLVLQPLVENSIVHGLEPTTREGFVQVALRRQGEAVEAVVSDNGVGCDAGAIQRRLDGDEESHDFFALQNIRDRLRLRFGSEASLSFDSRLGEGTTTTVVVPCVRESNP